jgi:hypothetical protein
LPPEILLEVRGMDPDSVHYVAASIDSPIVDIERLVLSRARPDGIRNAVALMKSASKGEIERRQPISVKPYGNLFLVADGNSTVAILTAIGAVRVPVRIDPHEHG